MYSLVLLAPCQAHFAGGGRRVDYEDLKAAVMKQISISDYSKIVPFKKATYKIELVGFSEGVGGRVLDGLTSMEVATGVKYHFLHTGRLVPVLRASAYANKRFFDNAAPESTEWMDLKFAGVHGQVLVSMMH
jgi:hypothetical protein